MKRVLSWAIGLPAAIILIAFAIANRQYTTVSLDPFSVESPWLAIPMPQWALLYGGIFIGLVAGGVAAWLKQGKWRKVARKARADLDTARNESDRLKQQLSRSDNLLASKEHEAAL